MIHEILQNAAQFKKQIAQLKSKSPVWPKIYVEYKGFVCWYSTLLHYNRGGKKYSRHHVECCHKLPQWSEDTWENVKEKTRQRLNDEVAKSIEFAIPVEGFDELIKE